MGIAHAALYTAEFEKTIVFYREVFGAQVTGYFENGRRGCWPSLDGDILEIFESNPMADGCFKHIAISCSDIGETWSRALAHGAQPHVMPKSLELPFDPPVRARIAFMKGINGEQIELWQQE